MRLHSLSAQLPQAPGGVLGGVLSGFVSTAFGFTGGTLLLCGALPQPAKLMNEAEFHHHVGEENILPHVEAALKRAAEIRGTTGPRQPQAPPAA